MRFELHSVAPAPALYPQPRPQVPNTGYATFRNVVYQNLRSGRRRDGSEHTLANVFMLCECISSSPVFIRGHPPDIGLLIPQAQARVSTGTISEFRTVRCLLRIYPHQPETTMATGHLTLGFPNRVRFGLTRRTIVRSGTFGTSMRITVLCLSVTSVHAACHSGEVFI
ncbi:hypothetical protein P152DRAFT_447479 [Eremomyces bilateralis CBS 781.70]|uniref:Uncharacterized protein n=1 Tax=Eremomyces bilateralis CBS 781.70 TaxID=1392243 RepID=A0A6G1GAZ6_9PEZI|nr:uncharacterized protein P152DRAFT_447479 [Eremomyces bilateralis CBS 781.70]KAF1815245.1 hypothetical protein P152DRAFT_447479 [Eremomyces bilateralis CBS 781.70]